MTASPESKMTAPVPPSRQPARLLLSLPLALSLGMLALWGLDRWRLGTLGTGDVPMAPSTALVLLVLAAARLHSLSSRATLPSLLSGGGVALVGLLSLGSAFAGIESSLVRLLTIGPVAVEAIPIGIMSPVTATAVVLLGFSLVTWAASSLAMRTAGAVTATLATLLALTVATGYALRAPLMYGAAVPMAALTSASIVLLGLGFVFATSPREWPLSQFTGDPADVLWHAPSRTGAVALGVVISAAILAATGVYLLSARDEFRRAAEADLAAASELKRNDVARWYRERAGDAQTLLESGVGYDELAAYLAGAQAPGAAAALEAWATSLRRAYGYRSVLVYDRQGTTRFASGSPTAPVAPDALARAIRQRSVTLDDFSATAPSDRRQLAFLAPMSVGQDGVVTAVVALVVDPRQEFDQMLRRWPFRSKTAETLLIRRDGSEAVYLTDLRLPRTTSRPLHHQPLASSPLLARALQGGGGAFEGADYDGAPVLAAASLVTGTPWLVLVQQQRAEIFEPLWRDVRLAGAFSAMLILTTTFALTMSSRQQTLRALEARLAVDRERRDSSERLRSALSASLDPFLVLDADARIVEWNESAERTFGWTRAEALGRSFSSFVLSSPFDADCEEALHAARRNEAHARLGARTTGHARTRSDAVFPAELTLIPVRLRETLSFSVVVRDITAQVKSASDVAAAQADAERLLREADRARRALLNIVEDQRRTADALRESENQLESRVQQRTTQLEAANRELEAFSYSVSHDLRAPLRAVDGYARMLDEDCGPALDDEGRRRLGVIQREARRMGTLIDDLLRLSRLSRQPLESLPIDMTALAHEVVADLMRDLPAGRIVNLRIGALPPALGDPGVIRQVWVNLLGNALKFTSTRAETEIVVAGRATGGVAEYSVSDNGVGFDMQYAEKLFGVFQRLHAAHEFEGTGVGLALAQRIVNRHGGQIRAVSAVEQGATFSFSLPSGSAAGPDAPEAAPPQEATHTMSGGKPWMP